MDKRARTDRSLRPARTDRSLRPALTKRADSGIGSVEKITSNADLVKQMTELFNKADKDKNNNLDWPEFRDAFRIVSKKVSVEDAKALWNTFTCGGAKADFDYHAFLMNLEVEAEKNPLMGPKELFNFVLQDYTVLFNALEKISQQLFNKAQVYKVGEHPLGKVFRKYDEDKSGRLDRQEFAKCLRSYAHLDLSVAEITELFNLVDTDHSNTVSFKEFLSAVNPFRSEDESGALERCVDSLCSDAEVNWRRARNKIKAVQAFQDGAQAETPASSAAEAPPALIPNSPAPEPPDTKPGSSFSPLVSPTGGNNLVDSLYDAKIKDLEAENIRLREENDFLREENEALRSAQTGKEHLVEKKIELAVNVSAELDRLRKGLEEMASRYVKARARIKSLEGRGRSGSGAGLPAPTTPVERTRKNTLLDSLLGKLM